LKSRRSGHDEADRYALRDLKKTIGVAQWETKIVTSLPKELKGSLPSVEALERELGYGV
jgi:hypothetical protein